MTMPAELTTAHSEAVLDEIERVVVGKRAALTLILTAVLAGGHVLIEDLPGLGKTLIAKSFARALGLSFTRVQFTPDLLPADLLGSTIYDMQSGRFEFRRGPIFTNLLLGDEINRTPPKTQAALLEAMAESQVSIDGETHRLPAPFIVLATDNPIEYEGTYPLPEAQLDRFLLKVTLPLPPREDEIAILGRHAAGFDPRNLAGAGMVPVATPDDIAAGVAAVKRVAIAPAVLGYIVDIARATRMSPSLSLGVSPRGATALLATSRAWAWLSGRDFVTPDDVKALAQSTLAHRLGMRPEAELEGVSVSAVLDAAINSVPVPR